MFILQALLQRSQLSCHCLSLALQLSELVLGCGLALQQVCTEQVGLGQPAVQLSAKPQALLLRSLQLLQCSEHLLPELLGLLLVGCLVGVGRVLCSCNLQPEQGCNHVEAGDTINCALELALTIKMVVPHSRYWMQVTPLLQQTQMSM